MTDLTQTGRQLLSASSRQGMQVEDQEDDVERLPKHAVPGKSVRLADRADEAAAKPVGYGDGRRIDRRAEASHEVDDGALATAFDWIKTASGGQPLPAELARRLQADLRIDLTRVRVHTDDAAAAAAAAVSARAFTIGEDIYFAKGAYDPASTAGIELIAHEVAHVAQNYRGTADTNRKVSHPDDHHEQHADDFARGFNARASSRFESTDPAELVDHVRSEGRRLQLPFMAELEEHFGQELDFVETYTGEAAELACRLMAASAFAVRNVVALADPTPQRETLMHELTHVMQMGGRSAMAPKSFAPGSLSIGTAGSAVEHEAESHTATPSLRADTNTIHRAGPGTTTPATTTPAAGAKEDLAKLQPFLDGTLKDNSKDKGKLRWAAKTGAYANPRYYHASKDAFTAEQFKTNGGTDDLLKAATSNGQMTGVKGGLLLHSTGSGYIVSKGATDYKSTVTEITKIDNATSWERNLKALTTLKIKVTWPKDGTLDETDPPTTGTESESFRECMRTAVATHFKSQNPPFAEYYKQVVMGSATFDSKTQGSIFEELVIMVGGGPGGTKAIPVWDSKDKDATQELKDALAGMKGGKGKSRADGDGMIATLAGGLMNVSEAKAYAEGKGPTGDDILKMKDYKVLMGDGHEGYYKSDDGSVTRFKMGHITYTIAAPEPVNGKFPPKVEATLFKWMDELGIAFDGAKPQKATRDAAGVTTKYSATTWSLNPPPTGEYEFTVQFNPVLRFKVPAGVTQINIPKPDTTNVPGLKISNITATVDDKHVLKSGTVTYGVDAADIKKAPESKPLTPGKDGAGGEVDNKVSGLTSKLKDFLPVDIDAAIVDDGVEATIKLKKGQAVPNLGGFTLDGDVTEIKATYKGGGTLSMNATVGLKHKNGKISGTVNVSYDSGWGFEGTLKIDEGLIPGVAGLEATITKTPAGAWKVGARSFTIKKKFGAIELTGNGSDLEYNITSGMFKGDLTLDADLGMFGKAKGTASIVDNKLTKGTLAYDSPELKYPKDKPVIVGTVGGTVALNDGKFSGDIRGSATLNIPALQKIAKEGVGLDVNAHIGEDGTYSGTIKSTKPLQIGKHLKIPSVGITLEKDGSLKGDFELEIVNIKNISNAKAKGTVDKSGVHIESAEATVSFGNPEGKFWGEITAKYTDAKGFDVTGTANYKIKDDLTATGIVTYKQETNAISVELKTTEITLLDKTIKKQLFKASKQFPIVNVYGLGIYVDIGFDLGFDFGFKITMAPSVKVEDFSLETLEFKRIAAKLEVGGDIYAQLTGTPKLGIGVFALDPSIIRGGGGLKMPIVGRLDIKPKATFEVGYSPDGGADASAKLGLAGEFGIKASVSPYAEFSVLNDVWNPKWEGQPLAAFEILKPQELFNFTVDLNSKEKQADPELPGQNAAKTPTEPQGDKTAKAAPAAGAAGTAETKGGSKDTPAKQGEAPSGGEDGPFGLSALMDKLKDVPGFSTAKKIFEYGKKIWAVVKPIWDIVSPLMDIIAKRIEEVIGLFDPGPSADGLGQWLWKLAKFLFNLSFGGISEVASAIRTLLGKAADFAKKLINKAVQDGHIGVKRHSYYIWMPWPKDNIEFMAAAEWKINIPGVANLGEHEAPGFLLTPSGAVGLVLYEALGAAGVGYTYVGNSNINKPYNDRWKGAGARG